MIAFLIGADVIGMLFILGLIFKYPDFGLALFQTLGIILLFILSSYYVGKLILKLVDYIKGRNEK